MIEGLTIALDAWIIQDENYGEFEAGDVTTFAVEFHFRAGAIEVVPPAATGPLIRHLSESSYRVSCPIVYLAPKWWVIDIGVPVYQERFPPRYAALGQWVQGDITLGIDPFFYFERLSKEPGSPPLIFEWVVDAIDMQAAPLIENEVGLRVRDPALYGWKRIAQTESWRDDGGNAAYLLHCRLKRREPRYTLIE